MTAQASFVRNLKIVAAVHGAVIVVLIVLPLCQAITRKKKPKFVPVEFMVNVGPREEKSPAVETVPQPEVKKPDTVPTPKKVVKKPPQQSPKKIVRTGPSKPAQKALTEKEIRDLLSRGARPGDHTSIPDEDDMCFSTVYRVLYDSWLQPKREEVGNSMTEAAIRLGPDGRILDRRFVAKSGNTIMDESVMAALNAVARIPGLTGGFLQRHPTVTVSFKVE